MRRICALKKTPKSNCGLVLSVVTQNANINLQKSDLFLYNRITQTWRLCGADVTSVSHDNKINNNGKTQVINTAISKTTFHRYVRPPPQKKKKSNWKKEVSLYDSCAITDIVMCLLFWATATIFIYNTKLSHTCPFYQAECDKLDRKDGAKNTN